MDLNLLKVTLQNEYDTMKIKQSKLYLIVSLILLLVILSLYFFIAHRNTSGSVDMLSVSTNGRYVISTDEKKYAVLWGI
jgi:hypothetical protein